LECDDTANNPNRVFDLTDHDALFQKSIDFGLFPEPILSCFEIARISLQETDLHEFHLEAYLTHARHKAKKAKFQLKSVRHNYIECHASIETGFLICPATIISCELQAKQVVKL
jgi:hypothetical protein